MKTKYIAFGLAAWLLFGGLLLPSISWADSTVAIEGISIRQQGQLVALPSQGVSVRQAGSGFELDLMVPSGQVCQPVAMSFNKETVVLSDEQDSTRLHPLYTTSWRSSGNAFLLSVSLPGYELPEFTKHQLVLKSGPSGVKFSCSDGATSPEVVRMLSSDYSVTFTTGEDVFKPEVHGVGHGASLNNAQVWWKGGEVTKGMVEYGPTPALGVKVTTPQGLDHRAQLSGLKSGTRYYYRVTSEDVNGNKTVSALSHFDTWSMGSVKVAEVTGHEASIVWTTSVPTDSIVEYGTSPAYSLRSGFAYKPGQESQLQKSHNVRLVNLRSDTRYHFRIKATNNLGVAVTQDLTFSTRDALAGPAPDVIEFPAEVVGIADDWSRYNLKDFPDDELLEASQSAKETSAGAVLSALDQQSNVVSYVKKGVAAAEQRLGWWVVWIVFPILLLLVVIGSYLYFKHDLRMNGWKLEMKQIEAKRQRSS